jgi:hypothetical protein
LDIRKFADSNRLKTAVDSDGTTIIRGRTGQIYEHGDDRFGVIFSSATFKTKEAWNTRRKQCEATGMELHQDGDYEGSLLFDPANKAQVKAAIKTSGVRPKRQLSAAQLEKMKRTLASYRLNGGKTWQGEPLGV